MNIYAGTYNGQVYMISGNPTDIRIRRRNQISQTSIRCLYLPKNSSELLSGGFDGQLIAINKFNLQSTKQTKEPKGIINCLQKVNENIVAVGLQTGLIRFWDWKSWNLKRQIREHKKPVRGFCIDPNSVLFFSAANNGLILWNTQKFEKVFHYKLDFGNQFNNSEIDQVLIDENVQHTFLINQKEVRQIKTENNEEVSILKMTPAETIQSAIIFHNFLIIGGDKGNIFIYSIGSYNHKISFQAHKLRVKCLKIIKIDDMDFLVTASSSGQIAVWDVLEFLKQIDSIGQDYNLQGLQPLSSVNLDRRVICIQVSQVENQPVPTNAQQNKKKEKHTQQNKQAQQNKKKNKKSGKKLPQQKTVIENQMPQNKEISDELKKKRIEKKKKLLLLKKMMLKKQKLASKK